MKRFIKKVISKKMWMSIFAFVVLSTALSLLASCSNPRYRAYPPGSYPPGTYPGPQGRYFPSEGNLLYLSFLDTFNIRDTEVYGRFLEEVMSLCRQNRNIGVYGEWHSGGSFGSPISSCQWAIENYNRFSVDLFMDIDPEHGSNVDMEFYVGYDGYGFYQTETQWISSHGRGSNIVGELKYEEDGDFRIVYRPSNGQPRITIRVTGALEDLEDGDKHSLSATIEYGGDKIGKGKVSIVNPEDSYYEDPYYYHY